MRIAVAFVSFALFYSLATATDAIAATVICKKTSNGTLTLRSTRCSRGETRITNISALRGAAGTNGTTGADGADGSLRVYGDGSAGALTVSGPTTWSSQEALGQYTTCSIASGATLTVPTGTVLRCSGAFTNEGTIVVSNSFAGPTLGGVSASGGLIPAYQPAGSAGLGWGRVGAGNGGYGDNSAAVPGGAAGFSLSTSTAANILRPGPIGGGAGGAAVGTFGGTGGGTITILAKGAVTNNGTIRADGSTSAATGGGGGAGGIIILASQVSTVIGATGSLEADGGDGGASSATRGNGGGGGGGLIRLIAPSITVSGTTSVAGGAAGSSVTSVTTTPRGGGGGGGSMAGAGGAGGTVASGDASGGATAGSNGLLLQTAADPTALF